MASINLGTFNDGFSGIPYTCYLIYDTPTRSGDYVTIKNVKVQIVSGTGQGTEGRVALNLSMPNGTSRISNGTIANAYVYPTNTTYTAVGSTGWQFSNLTTSFSYSITIADTGYSSSWSTTYSKTFTGSITCPARTYTVSYNANGGSGAPGSQTKTYNVSLTLSSTVPTYTGHTFKGWGTSSTSTTPSYQPGDSYTGNANLALYAIWEEDYTPPEERTIAFRGIWIMATSKLANIFKNILIKLVALENKFNIATTTSEFTNYLSSKINQLQTKCAVDYIVEDGTWGDHGVYRKWNSGVAECYGWFSIAHTLSETYGVLFFNGNMGDGYYTVLQTLPSGLFSEGPVITLTLMRGGGLVTAEITSSNKDQFRFFIISAAKETSANTVYYIVKAMGRWK